MRQLLYRPHGGGTAWRVLFTPLDEGELDMPTVLVTHVRHGAARPVSRREARALEDQGQGGDA
jgi:hypothetical protein